MRENMPMLRRDRSRSTCQIGWNKGVRECGCFLAPSLNDYEHKVMNMGLNTNISKKTAQSMTRLYSTCV
jgi:hypothetical protein